MTKEQLQEWMNSFHLEDHWWAAESEGVVGPYGLAEIEKRNAGCPLVLVSHTCFSGVENPTWLEFHLPCVAVGPHAPVERSQGDKRKTTMRLSVVKKQETSALKKITRK